MILKEKEVGVTNQVKYWFEQSGVKVINNYPHYGEGIYANSISLYFEINYCNAVKKIRISDHKKQHLDSPDQKPLRCIVVGKNTDMKAIKRFVDNTVEIVKKGSLKFALNQIGSCA